MRMNPLCKTHYLHEFILETRVADVIEKGSSIVDVGPDEAVDAADLNLAVNNGDVNLRSVLEARSLRTPAAAFGQANNIIRQTL